MKNPNEYLSFSQAEKEFPGLLKATTMRCWVHRGKSFAQLCTRAGKSVRIRRDRLETFIGEHRKSSGSNS